MKLGKKYKRGGECKANMWYAHFLHGEFFGIHYSEGTSEWHYSDWDCGVYSEWYELPDFVPPKKPKEPKPGEYWKVRDKENKCNIFIALVTEGRNIFGLGGQLSGFYDDFEFINQWKPVEDDDETL